MKLLKEYIRRLIQELDGFSMTGTRYNEVPHNMRYDVAIRPAGLDDIEHDPNEPTAVCILIVADDGKVLSVSRKDDPNAHGMPGGKIDNGETPEQAAIRELKEETGLSVDKLNQVSLDFDGTHMVATFSGHVSGEINTDESGVIRWVDPHILANKKTCQWAEHNFKLFKKLGLL